MKYDPKDIDPPEWDSNEKNATPLDVADFEEITTMEPLSTNDYEEL